MAHDATTEIREDVGRRGGLGEDVGSVDLAVELAKHKMTSGTSLVHKVNTKVDMLSALTAADRAFRPGNTRLIVGENWSRVGQTRSEDSQD